ncbi:MAG: CBS domain-containing protein [Candidatus Mcinerneyibacterium aminivorans]|uniref:CBS domain-containing protein n=1 Tax=Candidatus Mcinerneyibacterium aminivorans TaxID=2703815 RepID=A0A5D0MJG0_9BACT|nr:MAG: CBS domain-containing protein [Candidatus Mcinerneyibacterium aminivorans]
MKAILGHKNMDFDCFASMIAAKKLYPEYDIIFPDNIESMVKEYIEKEDIPFEYLFASDLNENITEVILVDNNNLERSGLDTEKLNKSKIIKIYDHHEEKNDIKIDKKNYIYKPYGANITLLLEEIFKRNIKIDEKERKIYLLGLFEDTGFLTYVSLTKNDVEMFKILFENLAEKDLTFINNYLLTDFNKEQLSVMDDLAENAEIFKKNNIKIGFCYAERENYIDNLAIVVQRLMIILSLDIIFVVVRLDKNIYFWTRSNIKNIKVISIAKELDGGGHPNAAYSLIKDKTFVEVKQKVYNLIDKYFLNKKTAGEVMSSEIVTADVNNSVSTVKEKMIAHNHSRLPVLKENSIYGVISKKEIDRLLNHGFGDVSIKNYVDFSIPSVNPEKDINSVKEMMISNQYPIILVVKKEELQGIITIEDLLKEEYPELAQEKIVKNFSSKLKYHFPEKINKIIKDIGKIADKNNYKAYIVGGVARDLILDRENYDLDIVIEGNGIKVARQVEEKYDIYVVIHKKFKTAVLDFDEFKIDIATARSETYKKPGALPDVMSSSLKYDLYRRDFTINAMAISISGEDFGDLYDYFDAYKDLQNKIIKIMHNISFIEDPTRILRGIRFATRFDFKFDKQTKNLLKNALDINMLEEISGRRIKDELVLMLKEDYPEKAFAMMDELNVLDDIIPGIEFDSEKEKLFREIRHVIHWYHHLYLDEVIERNYLYFFALMHKLNLEEIEKYSVKFELTKQFKIFAQQVKTFIRKKYKLVGGDEYKKSDVYNAFRDLKMETILYLAAFYHYEEEFQKYVSLYIIDIYPKNSIINGKQLKEMRIKNGLKIKKILEDIKMKHINDKINNYKEAVKYIKEHYLD